MPIFSKLHHIRLMAAATLLLLVCACSSDGNGDDPTPTPQIADSNQYINLSIVVSSGNEKATRAPQGGEDGDGREAGSERENRVRGITFMLYQSDKDKGTDGLSLSGDETLSFIGYYPVQREDAGTEYDQKTDEAIYTTDDQPLKGVDLSKKYHAIVVANADLTTEFKAGDNVKKVLDHPISEIYQGTGLGADANYFVMSSEKDYTMEFTDPEPIEKYGKPAELYKFDDPIHIERLAARVDFWMNNAEYKVKGDNEAYPINPGYEYSVEKYFGGDSKDKFVLTAITPFNLYNEKEYLIKRTDGGYLADEIKTSYVLDPKIDDKTKGNATGLDYYGNPLSSLVLLDKNQNTLSAAEKEYQSAKSLHDSPAQKATFTNDDYKDNFIICYPKENTLLPASPLYYYATGLAIEGDYYPNADPTKVKHLIYYGYLRHQGEAESGFYTIKAATDLDPEETGSADVAMNFGVVRNNIYRISIDQITEKDIKMRITVKKWDTFTHDVIYM